MRGNSWAAASAHSAKYPYLAEDVTRGLFVYPGGRLPAFCPMEWSDD